MFNNQRGVTLVELLTTITLLSIVLALIGSIHLFSQKQFIHQSEQVNQQSEIRNAITEISRQIRTTPSDQISVSENTLKIDDIEYRLEGNQLLKNRSVLAENIARFSISLDGSKLKINIESEQTILKDITALETTLTLRE
ncbi:PilW family protein [Gracilibacillus thailandensis]|uniref:Prepilin-type N-terminal cleavage/methylation domain-containing protein n=1 Tax=Gracilibacillus thailandensis TaxID=563735 RepID=A0A6N7R1M4_9BACI|nr:prepilin-type N-terminal cleavage/methylation domain-containing protein [Gracilibacillus thailandensis]MRI67592.1 prepilin-type N-terminal cleavage/methylation domain-containing protein [Gracilibacillus thailandensis]